METRYIRTNMGLTIEDAQKLKQYFDAFFGTDLKISFEANYEGVDTVFTED
jgi:hypothetical protein